MMSCRRSRFLIFLVPVSIHFTICADARTSVDTLNSISPVLHFQNAESYGIGTSDVFATPPPLPLPTQTIPPFPAPSLSNPAPVILTPPASPSLPKFPPGSSPPGVGASPPKDTLTPPKIFPSPPKYIPPVVLPPPSTPPQQHKSPVSAVWCVAKPTVPDPIIQEAMDYACGAGANCKAIQPNGSCFLPDTPLAHASYAFNSYFQNEKSRGGTCNFGGTAMLVTTDPSFNGCHFNFT